MQCHGYIHVFVSKCWILRGTSRSVFFFVPSFRAPCLFFFPSFGVVPRSSQLGEEPEQHEESEREEHEVQQVVATASLVSTVEPVHGATHGRLGTHDALFERLQHLVVRLAFDADVLGKSCEPGHLRAQSFDLAIFVELRATFHRDLHVLAALRAAEQRAARRGCRLVRRGRAFHPPRRSFARACGPSRARSNRVRATTRRVSSLSPLWPARASSWRWRLRPRRSWKRACGFACIAWRLPRRRTRPIGASSRPFAPRMRFGIRAWWMRWPHTASCRRSAAICRQKKADWRTCRTKTTTWRWRNKRTTGRTKKKGAGGRHTSDSCPSRSTQADVERANSEGR
mmetsp:Transcript_7895/g.48808  ORF Transcript_7895/g.48808 Transcript_7895/m.48808 type:complete len:341 (-) Transcript_7895:912-1934(-)